MKSKGDFFPHNSHLDTVYSSVALFNFKTSCKLKNQILIQVFVAFLSIHKLFAITKHNHVQKYNAL